MPDRTHSDRATVVIGGVFSVAGAGTLVAIYVVFAGRFSVITPLEQPAMVIIAPAICLAIAAAGIASMVHTVSGVILGPVVIVLALGGFPVLNAGGLGLGTTLAVIGGILISAGARGSRRHHH